MNWCIDRVKEGRGFVSCRIFFKSVALCQSLYGAVGIQEFKGKRNRQIVTVDNLTNNYKL